MKGLSYVAAAMFAYACATAPPPVPPPQVIHGIASWYGQEYAGRTTANGEIFDPLLLTAAHRTLPFGTVVEVRNSKTGQNVRVRVNDRGPYIGNRLIDLSYAAAQQIGLIEPGSGEVDVTVMQIGRGDREPPAAYAVTVPEVAPLPAPTPVAEAPATIPVVVDAVQVVEEHHGVETRRQVSSDGKKIENVPVKPAAPPPAAPAAPVQTRITVPSGKYVVQVGAFAQEGNARQLQGQLAQIGQQAYIDRTSLFRVRIGPFETRDAAIKTREQLEAAGISAIVVTQ
jgi:rare lipoprotein A